jgi:small subunit ribosomal protein S18
MRERYRKGRKVCQRNKSKATPPHLLRHAKARKAGRARPVPRAGTKAPRAVKAAGIPPEDAAKAEAVAGVAKVGRVAVLEVRADPAARAAASASIFARRRSANSVSRRWTSSTTSADILSQFVQERGKILPRRMTGVCSRHQRWLGVAIKRARNIALLPFAGSASGTLAPRAVEAHKP